MTATIDPDAPLDRLAIKPDPTKTAAACRALIRSQLSPSARRGKLAGKDALTLALEAFGLSADFLETEGGRWA